MAGKDSGLTDVQKKAADVNEDGTVSVDDAQFILLYYVANHVSKRSLTWEQILGGIR